MTALRFARIIPHPMFTGQGGSILGINAFHGESSAAILRDGAFCCGVEEERLNRIKHWAGFPELSIRAVLAEAEASLEGLAHVAVARDAGSHFLQKVLFVLRNRQKVATIKSRLSNMRKVAGIEDHLRAIDPSFAGRIYKVGHHHAHMASAFFCSPFDEAACLSIDGFGDFCSSMSAAGRGNEFAVRDAILYPHSLGVVYTAVTQFLGFLKYGDEYKIMGLAAYGTPRFLPQLRKVIALRDEGQFETNLEYFSYAREGVTMSWEGGEPVIGPLFSAKFVEEFGAPRRPGEELTDRHRDLAASLQALYEETLFHRLNWLHRITRSKNLCLAGGCAMNSVANGKIFLNTPFEEVFIQPAAGDAGTALGAALYVWHQVLRNPRNFVMEHSYWGPGFDEARIRDAAQRHSGAVRARRIESIDELADDTAQAIARGAIVGWYQGRSEWGPRALGNRSIVVDPRRAEMRDVLNERVKRREAFRPFAPSILVERAGDYFEESRPDPFMNRVHPVKADKRSEIPAVTHVDGTGRLQTVSERQNPRFWKLIRAFEALTGVPVVLNTSFNENEPIVNTPEEALDCFSRTRMDRLVLGDWVLERTPAEDRAMPAVSGGGSTAVR